MRVFFRKRLFRTTIIVLTFLLAFGPLLDSSQIYAAETEPADQPLEITQPVEPIEQEPSESIDSKEPEIIGTETEEADPQEEINSDEDAEVKTGPTNLRYEEVAHNSVKLAWDFIEDDDNDIDIWDADTGSWLTWGNLWSRSVGGLEPETTYRVYITWNKDRPSHDYKSNILEFTTTTDTSEYKDPPLTPPSYLRITDITDQDITLSWGSSPKATGYDLYVNDNWIMGTWENSATTATYSVSDSIEVGTKLTFRVGAQNQEVPPSAPSNAVTITWGALEAPQALQVITATRQTVSLGWAPVSGATSYDIYMDGTYLGSSENNRYVASGLEEGKTYSFTVMAKNSLWESSLSQAVAAVPGADYTLVSYYTAWSVYGREFYPEDVDVSKSSHINYAFADICWKKFGSRPNACQNEDIPLQQDYVYDGEIIIGDNEVDLDNFAKFRAIRSAHPNLKLMASVGGWSWSKNFSNMAADEITRRVFANSIVKFLREYQFDGIDIDWEYPVEGGEESNSRRPEDKQNFTLMMSAIRDALDAAGSEDGKYYLLSMASGQAENFIENADFANSVAYLDFINIMTYDFSGSWQTLANHNSPLYYDKNLPAKSAPKSAPRNNVRGALLGHLNGGVPNYKLVAGVPFYGKGWEGCPANGEYQICTATTTSFGTYETGLFDYFDLDRNYVNKEGYKRYWNDAAKVAYVYNPDKQVFITFNDENTMAYTASLVKTLDIAGTMNWDISGDRDNKLVTVLNEALPIDGRVNEQELAAPKLLTTNSITASSVQVKWAAVEGAKVYEVYIDDQFAGSTNTTSYTVSSLTPATNYKLHVLAVDREGDKINRVSVASGALNATTPSDSTSPSGPSTPPSSGSGSTSTPPESKDKGLLPVKVAKEGDKAVVTLPAAETVKSIKNTDTDSFRIAIEDGVKQAEILLPEEVIAALSQIDHAGLTVVIDGMEYVLPVSVFPAGATLKLSLGSVDSAAVEAMQGLLAGRKIYGEPFQLKLEKLSTDGKKMEPVSFGNIYVSGKVKFKAEGVNASSITGAAYIPGKDHLHSVPVLFAKGEGIVTGKLKLNANGIFVLLENGNGIFKDGALDWAAADISAVVTKMIASGDSSDQFGAKRHITRAEVIAMIVRGLGIISQESSTAPYSDVSSDSPFAEEILAAKQAGLVQGKSADRFDPDAAITRQELAIMLANAMKFIGKDNTASLTLLDKYQDSAGIAAYAQSSLALMVEHNIMKGVSATSLSPRTNVTKAQMAVTVMRMLRALELSN